METSTALGLLVGGAVLLLAVSPPRPVAPGSSPPAPAPGGALNPLNWFGSGAGSLRSQIFGQQPPAAAPPYGYQDISYSPQGAFQNYNDIAPQSAYTAAGGGGDYYGSGAAINGGGYQQADTGGYGGYGTGGAIDGGGYQNANWYGTGSPGSPAYQSA